MKRTLLARPRPSALRRHWALAPGITFLNHGSFGACPKEILALQEKFRREMEAEPVQFLWRHYEKRLEPSRALVARFIGARPQDVVFVTNATTGVNAIINSLRLNRGDELLTTSQDYNACRNILRVAAERVGARVVVAEVPFPISGPEQVVEAVLRAATRRTRLAMLDHVTSNTGLIFPIAALVRELKARGIETLVDGAHAPGMVPLQVAKLRAAYYTANLHKWVCAPKGAAFLWVRPDLQKEVQPAVVSHGNNTPRRGYSAFQDRFDWAGTFDPTAWFCAGAAIQWMAKLHPDGWAGIRRANRELAARARERLCASLEVAPPCPANMLGAMATIPLPKQFQGKPRTEKLDKEQQVLYDRFGIEVPFVRCGRPERRYFRISAQLYNSMPDYEYLGRVLREFK